MQPRPLSVECLRDIGRALTEEHEAADAGNGWASPHVGAAREVFRALATLVDASDPKHLAWCSRVGKCVVDYRESPWVDSADLEEEWADRFGDLLGEDALPFGTERVRALLPTPEAGDRAVEAGISAVTELAREVGLVVLLAWAKGGSGAFPVVATPPPPPEPAPTAPLPPRLRRRKTPPPDDLLQLSILKSS